MVSTGPWFWRRAEFFLTPWFPDLDPSMTIITNIPVWVKLPNLPGHLWHPSVFQGIGNSLGRYVAIDPLREYQGLYTYGRVCAEVDISKGLPDQINLKIGDFVWTQILDYENTAFRCCHCHQIGHLQNSCDKFLAQKKSEHPQAKTQKMDFL